MTYEEERIPAVIKHMKREDEEAVLADNGIDDYDEEGT
jgi:hypothetical protein